MADMLADRDDQDAPESPDQKEGQTEGGGEKPVREPDEVSNDDIEAHFKNQIQASEDDRRQKSGEWKTNIELRLGRNAAVYTGGLPTSSEDADIRNTINPDWSLTKAKTANLYSQVPEVRITHESKQYAEAIPPFARELNYELGDKRANVGVAMEEVLNDVVNAAGIGGVAVTYAARFDTVKVPASDEDARFFQTLPPPMQEQVVQAGLVPMKDVQRVRDYKFGIDRLSPGDLLTPAGFTGSDFNRGPWVGYTGEKGWAEASYEWGIDPEHKEAATQGGNKRSEDDFRVEVKDNGKNIEMKPVRFKRIFYWRYKVDPNEKCFHCIWEMVYVEGIQKPVRHRAWKGQQWDEQSKTYLGARKFPVQYLTITYISDNPIPPSDSSASRPQVRDMQRSRDYMFKQRDRSVPMRWFNPVLVDPEIQDNLMRGTWDGMIPTKGDGSKSFGEIARASYPSEDFQFDAQTKADIMEMWQMGSAQTGGAPTGGKTKAEVQIDQANFQTRIGQERGRVASFMLNIAEVLAGMMSLYSDYPTLTLEEKQKMNQVVDFKKIVPDLVLKIRPDSTVLLDAKARAKNLMEFINLTAKSGFVNVQPLLVELAELYGLDPTEVIIKPQPKQPDEPTISYRFTGREDLQNPLVAALLKKKGQLPAPQEIEEAKAALHLAQQPFQPPPPQIPGQPGQPQIPGRPVGAGQTPAAAAAAPHPQQVSANQGWVLASKIAKRSQEMTGGR